jgi:hypothetical protein
MRRPCSARSAATSEKNLPLRPFKNRARGKTGNLLGEDGAVEWRFEVAFLIEIEHVYPLRNA